MVSRLEMSKPFKRLFVVFATTIFLLASPAAVAFADEPSEITAGTPVIDTHTAKEKKAAKLLVKKFMKYAKSYNTKKMSKCFDNPKKNDFFVKKEYMAKYCRKYNKKLKYKFVSMGVDEDGDMEIKVRITYRDGYYAFMYGLEKSTDWCVDYARRNLAVPSDSLIDAKIEHYMVKGIKKRGFSKSTEDISFVVFKQKGKWKIWKTDEILNAVNLGYNYAYDTFYSEEDDDDE